MLNDSRLYELPPNSNDAHIKFLSRRGCHSPVGKSPNTKEQKLAVGKCKSSGQIIHEIMHILGITDLVLIFYYALENNKL